MRPVGHEEASRVPHDLWLRSQERINCLEGTHEFFEAIGFQKVLLPIPDQGKRKREGPWLSPGAGVGGAWLGGSPCYGRVTCPRVPEGPEEFYVLSEAALDQPQSLEQHKEQLLRAEPVRATLARQRLVFQPSPLASHFDLPADFFSLTAEELKREQRLRSEAVERLSVLRTKAMREREEQREMRKYTYTLLRVRFPDGCLLQGACWVLAMLPWVCCAPAGAGCSGLILSRGRRLRAQGGSHELQRHTCAPARDLLRPGAGGSTVRVCPGGLADRLAAF